jgi:glycine/D-amino acid oxidase-like deaminating enzyme
LREEFPAAKDSKIDYEWAGIICLSLDRKPLIGKY